MKNDIHIRAHELSKIISDAQKELDELKKKCKHENFHEGNYMSGPGRIVIGNICDDCFTFLGKTKDFKFEEKN